MDVEIEMQDDNDCHYEDDCHGKDGLECECQNEYEVDSGIVNKYFLDYIDINILLISIFCVYL